MFPTLYPLTMAGRGQPKTGGRKKGTPNKNTLDRDELRRSLEEHLPEFWMRMANLEDKDYCSIMTRLLPFVVPQLKSVDANVTNTEQTKSMEDILKSLSDRL